MQANGHGSEANVERNGQASASSSSLNFGGDVVDAAFQSKDVQEQLRHHQLWHGDLLSDRASFAKFRQWLESRLPQVKLTPQGYFTAALATVNATTNDQLALDTLQYATCLWTRDVCNVSLALFVSGDSEVAARAIVALAALYSRADHAECMERMIASKGATYNNFTVAPVRFEASTGNRTDPWAHMQLDALGLFLTAYGVFGAHRLLTPDITLISRFIRYLAAIEYWQRADLGHWEEWPALVRTSSIGCCVAGLRAAASLLPSDVREELRVDALADKGYRVLKERLSGPDGAWEAEGRKEDAALLTLLLPPVAEALALTPEQRAAITLTSLKLRRGHGLLRYVGDSYYGADYQSRLRKWKQQHANGDPGAYPQPDVRDSWAVDGCEAEWTIFEPLLLLQFLWAHSQEPSLETAGAVRRSLMRMLAAIEGEAVAPAEGSTPPGGGGGGGLGGGGSFGGPGGGPSSGPASANGCDVRLHVHESYTVVNSKRVPNDVQDLMWAVAYVRMALAALESALQSNEGSFIKKSVSSGSGSGFTAQ